MSSNMLPGFFVGSACVGKHGCSGSRQVIANMCSWIQNLNELIVLHLNYFLLPMSDTTYLASQRRKKREKDCLEVPQWLRIR